MSSIILTHLGESIPLYIKDCVHQIRIWNTVPIYIILEPCHKDQAFWTSLHTVYSVTLVYTDTLIPTEHHKIFQRDYKGDTAFRKGYWKHVRERFFYIEELMERESLRDAISMEYDVLLYTSLETLKEKFRTSHQTLRMVMDNPSRGHPAFLYIPSVNEIRMFSMFLVSLLNVACEDMQSLALFSQTHEVHYLPVITEQLNRSKPVRRSLVGHESSNTWHLSEDSEHFGVLFDSLVVGQWIGGIDSRNTRGNKALFYQNESALYSIKEMKFQWIRENGLWKPMLDDRPLVTIHIHSKALHSFLSDRVEYPSPDYNVESVNKSLLPN